jgi:hypothetical protein
VWELLKYTQETHDEKFDAKPLVKEKIQAFLCL